MGHMERCPMRASMNETYIENPCRLAASIFNRFPPINIYNMRTTLCAWCISMLIIAAVQFLPLQFHTIRLPFTSFICFDTTSIMWFDGSRCHAGLTSTDAGNCALLHLNVWLAVLDRPMWIGCVCERIENRLDNERMHHKGRCDATVELISRLLAECSALLHSQPKRCIFKWCIRQHQILCSRISRWGWMAI